MLKIVLSLYLSFFTTYSEAKSNQECIHDTCFKSQHKLNSNLELQNLAVFKYWGFKIYKAAIYWPSGSSGKNVLNFKPKLLELHYDYNFTVEDFVKSSREILERHGKKVLAKYGKCLSEIDSLYRPIKPGDRYTIYHSPKGSLELYHNFELLGSVCDDQFASAYLSIWLSHKHSIDNRLQLQLLSEYSETTELSHVK